MQFRKSNHPHRQAFSGLVRFYIIIIIIKIVYCVQRGTFDGSKRYNANIQRKYRSQQKRAPWQILTYLHGEPPLKRHDTPALTVQKSNCPPESLLIGTSDAIRPCKPNPPKTPRTSCSLSNPSASDVISERAVSSGQSQPRMLGHDSIGGLSRSGK
ncbi:hypothetical protein EYC84_006180 [Monilinia fructicola]|uniref:Uncharacterized protein n=1 Tax=Monilinia fructicola TaxID=38448 RepID=A0A5M9K5C1_MONFR|nr:hypothetical protein EYC84_006180 [Monilinia fructicola]